MAHPIAAPQSPIRDSIPSQPAVDSDQSTEKSTCNSIPRLRPPRSLPPWIDSYEERYGPAPESQLRLLNPPGRPLRPHRNAAPSGPRRRISKDGFVTWDDPQLGPAQGPRPKMSHFLRYGRASRGGRKWDHLRSADPVIVSGYNPMPVAPSSLTWQDFVQSSAWGRRPSQDKAPVDEEILQKLQPTFDHRIGIPPHAMGPESSRQFGLLVLHSRIWYLIFRHSLSPLFFRLAVMFTSITALGISARIFELENAINHDSAERTQSLVAIVVDCLAIPYSGYMIWDEYAGKPVGLRSGISKIRLILLDVFFIIFKSVSTALAFETLVYHQVEVTGVRPLSAALGVLMLAGLISWTMNFTVNVFRTVERLGGGDYHHGTV